MQNKLILIIFLIGFTSLLAMQSRSESKSKSRYKSKSKSKSQSQSQSQSQSLTQSKYQLPDETFDHLALSLIWPSTYVMHNAGRADRNLLIEHHQKNKGYLFTIHGLIPRRGRGNDGPVNCILPNQDFNYRKVSKISSILKYWKSFGPYNDSGLWKHEWDKHGKCAAKAKISELSNQEKYFKFSLQKAKEFDIRVFKGIPLVASDTQSYNFSDIKARIERSYNSNLEMKCLGSRSNVAGEKGKMNVYDIKICFNLNCSLINCPGYSNCDPKIYFPQIPK